MTLARTADLIAAARRRGRGVAAFNVITLEQAEAVVAAAEQAGRGLILQVSQNAIRFRRGFAPLLAACCELARAATQPVALHADHIDDPELAGALLARAEELGLGSLMFDASTLPYEQNLAATARVAAAGHRLGLWVEGELGEVGGKDGAHAPGVRTDPDDAVAFVASTGVDGLAVAVGSSHAMLERTATLDLDLIAVLDAVVPVPLVLHGSSGVPDEVLDAAVGAGIRKVNIGTALAIAGTARLRQELADRPKAVDPRRYLDGVREATAATAVHLLGVVA
ncbi:MAG: class II fructose-bisphosphate aldolase [Propionicimonas sp.]|uniref:class II fructose-bisphosphate aldolase n=1 Tax=Propionicimonas sp. TaxID=1955623 RepID=UPI002B1E957D|nr:class II fructose-bisphosphate aldolase [Propionicimonas sp.]MEA4945209.1 class II fructose-bisphosphate aldolase [Propionicimonas sp.]